jgi:hypothetical protein
MVYADSFKQKAKNVVFESGSQICFNSISMSRSKPPWKINGLISDIEAAAKRILSSLIGFTKKLM